MSEQQTKGERELAGVLIDLLTTSSRPGTAYNGANLEARRVAVEELRKRGWWWDHERGWWHECNRTSGCEDYALLRDRKELRP